jgi:hypothetical protein
MQALAAEFSGWRRKIPLLYLQKSFKTVCGFMYLKNRLLNGRAASV